MGIYNKFGIKYMFNEIVMVPNLHFLNVMISIILSLEESQLLKKSQLLKTGFLSSNY